MSTSDPDESDDERSGGDGDRVDGNAPRADGPSARAEPTAETASDGVTIADDGLLRWFLRTDDGTVVAIRDVLTGVAVVAVVALVLFAVSGVWPPLVAVESASMEPNLQKGDLVFVVDETRFVGDGAVGDTGIVTASGGTESGHETFGGPGDVIVFRPGGSEQETPIIHRAHFWVENDEDWVDAYADSEFVNGADCDRVTSCPADRDGFVTKGDANPGYDQTVQRTDPRSEIVDDDWVVGKAMVRIPWLGHVRLQFESLFALAGGVGLREGALASILVGTVVHARRDPR